MLFVVVCRCLDGGLVFESNVFPKQPRASAERVPDAFSRGGRFPEAYGEVAAEGVDARWRAIVLERESSELSTLVERFDPNPCAKGGFGELLHVVDGFVVTYAESVRAVSFSHT